MAVSEKFQRFVARQRARRYIRYVYARETVPPQALGVVVRHGPRWWFVTPAFPHENSEWRVSYGDEQGAAGHYIDTAQGKPFNSKYDALVDVLMSNKAARITEYVLPSGEHAYVGRQRAAQPNPRVHRGRAP